MGTEEVQILFQTLLHFTTPSTAKNEDAEGLVDQGFMVFDKEVHQRGFKEISSCGKTKEFKMMPCTASSWQHAREV